jgi:hypothetical protein
MGAAPKYPAIVPTLDPDLRGQSQSAEFWDEPRGLAAVLDEGDGIGEITGDHIEIVKSKRSILRFQRRAS